MSELQPNQTPNFSRFADWCLHKDSLSEEARHTVEVLLEIAGTSDCYEAERILLNYTELRLRAYQSERISDLRPLFGLIKLRELDLGLNRILDLSPLSELINLRKLRLDYNQISNLSPLSGLIQLEELHLQGNSISDVSPLSGLSNLKVLDLNSNSICDLNPLSGLTNLLELYLRYNNITDLSSLSKLTNLAKLHLGNNSISDLSPLSELTNLTYLYLESNTISNLSPLSGLTNLFDLSIPYNQISDFSPISSLINLGQVYLDCNRFSDLSVLSGLTNLKGVDIAQSEQIVYDSSWLLPLQNKWHSLLTVPINEQKAIKIVKSIYAVIGYEEPKIIVCSSPKINVTYLGEQQNWGESLFGEIWYSIGQRNQSLWFLMSSHLQNQISQEQPLRSIIEGLSTEDDSIENEYEEDEKNTNNFKFLEGYYITSDDLMNIIGATKLLVRELQYQLSAQEQELLQCLNQLFENCGWIFPFEKVCVVCDRPRKICLDSDNHLHAEAEPAIQFADGWHTGYYYHGVKIPEKYGKLHPQQWQPQWLLEEDNAELRRVLIQGIGYDRICEELQAQELDSWQEYTLLCIDADVDVEPIHLLKMTCPSTGRIHTLRVPPDIKSARIAIQWVNWDIDPEDFAVQT